MSRSWLSVSIILLVVVADGTDATSQELLTRAEKSEYAETSRYVDVMEFLRELQGRSLNIKLETMAVSTEGREIPLAILGDPMPVSAHQARYDDRPAVYIQANIHAGEVEGKEAALMLMRDVLFGELRPLLEDQILLVAPIFNPDGNDRISTQNRRNQRGPTEGVGVRSNAQNLDLNRDFIKLESPENQGLVQNVLGRWDPILLVDCHTTNGSYHRESVTYAVPHNPNGDSRIICYLRDTMLPTVARRLKEVHGYDSVPYGNFVDRLDPNKGWRTFSSLPRFCTNYIGLRNRFAILDENYAYADFKTRVLACYGFFESILHFTNTCGREMQQLVREIDRCTVTRALHPDSSCVFIKRSEIKPFDKPVEILSYEFELYTDEEGTQRARKTDRHRSYTVPYFGQFEPTETIAMPCAYLFPGALKEVAEKLVQHGIEVEVLSDSCSLEVEVFQIDSINTSERLYQGHQNVQLEGSWTTQTRAFEVGAYFVDTAQPLAALLAYLLEPESNDGLAVWNFFDRYLYASQWHSRPGTYPVFRMMVRQPLARSVVKGG